MVVIMMEKIYVVINDVCVVVTLKMMVVMVVEMVVHMERF